MPETEIIDNFLKNINDRGLIGVNNSDYVWLNDLSLGTLSEQANPTTYTTTSLNLRFNFYYVGLESCQLRALIILMPNDTLTPTEIFEPWSTFSRHHQATIIHANPLETSLFEVFYDKTFTLTNEFQRYTNIEGDMEQLSSNTIYTHEIDIPEMFLTSRIYDDSPTTNRLALLLIKNYTSSTNVITVSGVNKLKIAYR